MKDRKVAYAAFDPALCRELFITHALVRHEYATKGAFMEHNRRLLDEVSHLRDKARQSDMLVDEYALAEFFEQRVPASVVNGATFETWLRSVPPATLELSREDILLDDAVELSPERYPDQLVIGGTPVKLHYKFEPGEADDGITAVVPLALLPQLDPDVLAWTIPGWHEAKIRALLEGLPKPIRKLFVPLDDLVRRVATTLRPFAGPLLPTLERAIFELTGERIARTSWDLRAVPAYLDMSFRIVDDRDKPIAEGRDLAEMQRMLGQRAKDLWARAPREQFERTGMKAWDLDALPESVTLAVGGRTVLAYPALVDKESSVDVRLLESASAAADATRDGLRRLILLSLPTTLVKLDAQVPTTSIATKRQLVLRALDDAFQIAATPRTKTEFAARLAEGRAALPETTGKLARLAGELSVALDKVRAAMKALASRPGATRTAIEDITGQLARLVPADLLRATPLPRLVHIARYLKAIEIRLQRLSHDPQKDQQKAALVAPFWKKFLAAPDDEIGWLLEEFRVQTFAPELKTAVPVSAQRLTDAWSRLGR